MILNDLLILLNDLLMLLNDFLIALNNLMRGRFEVFIPNLSWLMINHFFQTIIGIGMTDMTITRTDSANFESILKYD
jgi:hypothetical protein